VTTHAPIGWGGGALGPTGWTLQSVGLVRAEETMRARLLMLVNRSAGDPVGELDAWRIKLGDQTLAAWLMAWAVQRPLQLQGLTSGYPVTGHQVLDLVDEISTDLQARPLRTWGVLVTDAPGGLSAPPRLGVRYTWLESDPLVVVRCPPTVPDTWPARPPHDPMPDAWKQVQPAADGWVGPADRWLELPEPVGATLEAWAPGGLDTGLRPLPEALQRFLAPGHGPVEPGALYVPKATVSCTLCLEPWDMALAKVPDFVRSGCPHCKAEVGDLAVFEHENASTRRAPDYLRPAAEPPPILPAKPVTPGEAAKLDAKLARRPSARRV
jgi:hypothetical protein